MASLLGFLSVYSGLIMDSLKAGFSIGKNIYNWFQFRLPANRLLGDYINNNKVLKIYIKDLDVPNNTLQSPKLFSQEGAVSQINPNISKVWPDVEGYAVAELFNLFGLLGKSKKIEIVEMSKGFSEWHSNMIVLGAQAVKSREFYAIMQKVAYEMDDTDIYESINKNKLALNYSAYGYGLILKSHNPYTDKPAFLLGGLGTLGTKASVYFFIQNIAKLGKEFDNKCFGLVVRARHKSGYESTERLRQYDKVFEN